MPTDLLHRRAAMEFGAKVLLRAGYREHFKRPEFHGQSKEAAVHMQKRDPTRRVSKRLLEGIARLARKAAGEHGVKFRKKIEVEKGRHSIVFRAAK